MVFPVNFWLLFAAAMLISSIGFKKYVWFISLGYGFSIAGEGLLMAILYGKTLTPGTLLCCLCPPEREAEFARLMLKHTTTIGVRGQTLRRYTLQREAVTLDTPYGPVRAKRSHGYGVDRTKPEFDDLAQIAEREGIAVGEINF